jgi:hypothetical protein
MHGLRRADVNHTHPREPALGVHPVASLLQAIPSLHRTPRVEVICGLKVWRVDPNVDPGIHKQIPEEAFDARIRRIEPQVCRY